MARKAKNRQAGGGGRKKAGMGEQNTRGVMNRRITKKKILGPRKTEGHGRRTSRFLWLRLLRQRVKRKGKHFRGGTGYKS